MQVVLQKRFQNNSLFFLFFLGHHRIGNLSHLEGELLYFLKVFRTTFGLYFSQSNYRLGEFSCLALSTVGCGEHYVFFFSFFSLLLTELEYLWGVGAVMVRDTASSAGDEENVVFCPLFVR